MSWTPCAPNNGPSRRIGRGAACCAPACQKLSSATLRSCHCCRTGTVCQTRRQGDLHERNLETARKARPADQTKRPARLRLRLSQTTQGTAHRCAPRAQRRRPLRPGYRRLRGRSRSSFRQLQESGEALRHQPFGNLMARSRRPSPTQSKKGRRQSRRHAPTQKEILESGQKHNPQARRSASTTRFRGVGNLACASPFVRHLEGGAFASCHPKPACRRRGSLPLFSANSAVHLSFLSPIVLDFISAFLSVHLRSSVVPLTSSSASSTLCSLR